MCEWKIAIWFHDSYLKVNIVVGKVGKLQDQKIFSRKATELAVDDVIDLSKSLALFVEFNTHFETAENISLRMLYIYNSVLQKR